MNNDMMRKKDWDRDRVMTDEEALAYHEYIKPIMHARATEVIDRHNAAYRAIDPEVHLKREKQADIMKRKYHKQKAKRLRV